MPVLPGQAVGSARSLSFLSGTSATYSTGTDTGASSAVQTASTAAPAMYPSPKMQAEATVAALPVSDSRRRDHPVAPKETSGTSRCCS